MSRNLFSRRKPSSTVSQHEFNEAAHAQFMEAFAAACAIAACADGDIAPVERRQFMAIARGEQRLAPFSYEELSEEFACHAATFRMDVDTAAELAYEKLDPMRARPRDAMAIVEACRKIVQADGVTFPDELKALDQIRRALGLDPDDGAAATIPLLPNLPASAAQAIPAAA